MKKFLKYIIPLFITLFVIQSCTKEDEPYLVYLGSHKPDPGEKVRKILLEEFTGHLCINCPEGSLEAHNLKQFYGDQLILIAIHAGSFAEPDDPPYEDDYRTAAGNELNAYFNVPFYPTGMVNRTEYNGEAVLQVSKWQDAIAQIVNNPPDAFITFTTTYDTNMRKLIVVGEIEILLDLQGAYNIAYYIVENGIISAQKNNDGNLGPTPDWLDYEHNHVLRTAVYGPWGVEIINSGANPGQIEAFGFDTTMNPNWKAENCEVIIFLFNASTKEVIQAEEMSVI